jgi:daunorubicin/doxorubicin transport system permease protein
MSITAAAIDDTVRATVTTRFRPSPPGPVSSSLTFAWRGFLKVKHIPEQLADVILIPILFTLVFTYLFGGALAGSPSHYLQFLLPGTLVMTILLLTVYTGVGLNTDIATGAFDRFRTLPIWRPAPIVGALLGDLLRYLLAAALVVGLGLGMGFRPDGGPIGVLAAVALILLFSFSLSWVWTTLALVLRTPHSVNVAGLVFLFPLTFTSNVFVDPQTMPGWLQTFIDVNPISHLVTAARGVIYGTATTGQIGWVLIAGAVLVAVFAPLTVQLYRHKS